MFKEGINSRQRMVQLHWKAIQNIQKRNKKLFYNELGEKVEHIELKEFYELHDMIKEAANKTFKIMGKCCLEKEYETNLSWQLHEMDFQVEEQTCVKYKTDEEKRWILMDITDFEKEDGKIVFELKVGVKKSGINQLIEYMKITDAILGYLICFGKRNVNIFSVYNDIDGFYWYDGTDTYKQNKAA